MRKNYFLRTALSLLVLLCSFAPSWGATYKKITTLDELESGKTYVITGSGYSNAMSADNSDNKYFRVSAVTISNNEIANPVDNIVWIISKESDGNYSIKNGTTYVACTSDQNNAQKGTTYGASTAWTISVDGGVFTFTSVNKTNRALQYNANNTQERFAAYKKTQKNLTLYKLDESAASLTEATISFDGITGDVTKYLSEEGYEFTVTTNSTATVQYSSSDTDVAEIAEGIIMFKAPGETVIKAWVEQNDEYTAAETFYTLTVVDDSDPQLSFPESITDPYTVDLSLGSFDSKATAKSTGAITYASTVEEVAMIDENGEVVLMGAGETEISATIAAAGTYVTSTISYKLIVTKTESFKKATSISDGRYIIAYADGQVAMNTTNAGKYFNGTNVTITDDVIKTADATIIWEITQEADGNYSIKNGDIYLSLTANDNNAFIGNGYNDNSAWTISVSADGVATITNIAYDNRSLKYNSSSPRFACYASGQKSLTLYRFDDGKKVTAITFPEELGIVGNKVSKYYVADETFSSAVTVTLDDVVDATVPVTYSSDNEAVATIDAATGLVTLKGVGSTTISATVEESATYSGATISYTLTLKPLTMPLTETITFTDWSKVEGSGTSYDSFAGDQILPGSDGVDYTWNFTNVRISSGNLQARQDETTVLESPAFVSDAGFVYIVTFEGEGDVTLTAKDGTTVTGASPLSLTVNSTEGNWVRLTNPTASTIITEIKVQYGVATVLSPVVAFADETLTGEVTKTTEVESFDSKAIVTVDDVVSETIPVKYSSSVAEVATINDAGLVTIVGAGETVIKAEVEAVDGEYYAAQVEYTLVVREPAVMKTFKKVTDGTVVAGEYLLVYSNGTTTIAMNNTLNGSGESTRLEDTDITTLVAEDGSISTDDTSIVWTLTKEDEENNYWSISNSGSYAACTKDGNYAQYVSSYDNSKNTTAWTISASEEDFKIQSVAYNARYLQYNSSATSTYWGGYKGTQQDPMLYKLDDGTPNAIESVEADALKVINGKGQVTIVTDKAMPVAIYAMTGALVYQGELAEGANVIDLPAGIYVVNGQKVIVF